MHIVDRAVARIAFAEPGDGLGLITCSAQGARDQTEAVEP